LLLYVPSIRETCEWYIKHLNWYYGGDAAANDEYGHASLCPYTCGGDHNSYQHLKGFHLRASKSGAISNSGCFVFVSGLEALRANIVNTGWDKIGEIIKNGWGSKTFAVTDINGFVIEFGEWDCD